MRLRRLATIIAVSCAAVGMTGGMSSATADTPQDAAAVYAYWTPERIQDALDHPDADAADSDVTAPGPPTTSVRARASNVNRRWVGVFTFFDPGQNKNRTCSAVEVNPGRQGGIIATAAHCVRDDHNNGFRNFFYIPESKDNGQGKRTQPNGGFFAFNPVIPSDYNPATRRHDIAFLRAPSNDRHEDMVHLLGPGYQPVSNVLLPTGGTIAGYPGGNVNKNLTLCADEDFRPSSRDGEWIADHCESKPGMSGGPLLVDLPTGCRCQTVLAGTIWGRSSLTGQRARGVRIDSTVMASYRSLT
jgi:hypothetical protein